MAQVELMDFFEWIATVEIIEDEYCAEYDESFNVISVHPYRVTPPSNSVKIDEELALAIFEGKDTTRNYKIDKNTLELVRINSLGEIKTVNKMDDVLHRIIDKKWTNIDEPHVSIVHHKDKSELHFSLNSILNAAVWNGDTEMIFLITEYNDPNILKHMVSLRIGDITGATKIIKLALPETFSIYTRRLFDKYVFEAV
jgi:hypothetical protein